MRFPDFRAPTERTLWVFGVRGSKPVVLVTTDAGGRWKRSSPSARAYFAQLTATGRRAWLTTAPLPGEGALFSSGVLGQT